MDSELLKLLVTTGFVAILIIMSVWLIKSFASVFVRDPRDFRKDDFDRAGYESMAQMRRKERIVTILAYLVIVICILLLGGLTYLAISSEALNEGERETLFNISLAIIPAIILLLLVARASFNYVKKQEEILEEFRHFQSKRRKELAEYQQKRSGKQESTVQDKENPEKKTTR